MATFRWVGSKAGASEQICLGLSRALPLTPMTQQAERVISPFLGSGALEIAALGTGLYAGILAFDACRELRCLYSAVRESPTHVFLALKALCALPEAFTEAGYFRVRAENGRGGMYGAARFLYLQAYSFRGLFRVNRQGEHNTPPDKGRLAGYRIDFSPGGELWLELRVLSRLMRTRVEWSSGWAECIGSSGRGDLIVADPPYLDTFGGYSRTPFLRADQEELAHLLHSVAMLGRRVLAFNSPAAAPLYEGWSTRHDQSRASRMVSRTGHREADCLFVAGFSAEEEALFFGSGEAEQAHNRSHKGSEPTPTLTEAA